MELLEVLSWLGVRPAMWCTPGRSLVLDLDEDESQGCEARDSRVSLLRGSVSRQACIKSLHAGDSAVAWDQSGRPCRICSSVSNGMSPNTRSCNNIPRDHTVRLLAVYLLPMTHSGGAYTRVPSKSL